MSAGTLRRVWTLPVRLAHWSLAALMVFELFYDSGGKPHRYAGYAAAAIVGLRLIYGITTRSEAARVHLPQVSACLAHLREMSGGHVARIAGHNPLGAAMSLLLWTLVLLLALTGWVSRWDRFWGEDWPVDLHAALSYALQAGVVLHLAGVALSSYLERQNLLRGMLNGNKHVDDIGRD